MAKARAKTAEKPEPKASVPVIFAPKSNAISKDVGISAVRMLVQAANNRKQITALQEANASMVGNRGKGQVDLAIALWRGQLADPTLNLIDTVTGNKTQKDALSARCNVIVGLREVRDGKVDWTNEAKALMVPQPTDDKDTKRAKDSIGKNYSTMLTKAVRVALYAVENGIVFDKDKVSGLLRIADGKKGTGAVKARFGSDSVLLNENVEQPTFDKRGKEVGKFTAKVKPSFMECLRGLGEAHGDKAMFEPKRAGTGTPGATTGTAATSGDDYVVQVCGNLLAAIAKIPGKVPDKVRKALEQLRNAIDKAID